MSMPSSVQALSENLSPKGKLWLQRLVELGQEHIVKCWPKGGLEANKAEALFNQLELLDASYPNGLAGYVKNAKKLLKDSRDEVNPFLGFIPAIPEGENLETLSSDFINMEKAGLEQLAGTCFVMVAGGLGERLGYNGIKISLPSELCTEKSFVQTYIESILAFQARARKITGQKDLRLPLAIMTSGDTHIPTEKFLRDNKNFGLEEAQVTLMRQEKVPSLLDNEARFAVNEDGSEIETKPHGHGDVHTLLLKSGLAEKWKNEGRKWVLFFQDTNGLVFNIVPAALGVSHTRGLEVNSITVSRPAGDATGSITRLEHKDGRSMTVSVEYNQLSPLLKATVNPEGDVADPATGFSPYPGNINALLYELEPYVTQLLKTGGGIPEFVNPKYADKERTTFKKPTRLECMMQDYPQLLPAEAKVGFTNFDRWLCFSAVKNSLVEAKAKSDAGLPLECAASGEMDLYQARLKVLEKDKSNKVSDRQKQNFAGLPVTLAPKIVLAPTFALSQQEVLEKIKGLDMDAHSTLLIDGQDIHINGLKLRGTLIIRAVAGAKVQIKNLEVQNKGWNFEDLPNNATHPEYLNIRGYYLNKLEQRVLEFTEPGDYTVFE